MAETNEKKKNKGILFLLGLLGLGGLAWIAFNSKKTTTVIPPCTGTLQINLVNPDEANIKITNTGTGQGVFDGGAVGSYVDTLVEGTYQAIVNNPAVGLKIYDFAIICDQTYTINADLTQPIEECDGIIEFNFNEPSEVHVKIWDASNGNTLFEGDVTDTYYNDAVPMSGYKVIISKPGYEPVYLAFDLNCQESHSESIDLVALPKSEFVIASTALKPLTVAPHELFEISVTYQNKGDEEMGYYTISDMNSGQTLFEGEIPATPTGEIQSIIDSMINPYLTSWIIRIEAKNNLGEITDNQIFDIPVHP